jgi:hypothetical protein
MVEHHKVIKLVFELFIVSCLHIIVEQLHSYLFSIVMDPLHAQEISSALHVYRTPVDKMRQKIVNYKFSTNELKAIEMLILFK